VPVEIHRAKNKPTLTLVLGERPESADTTHGEENAPSEKKQPKSEEKEWQGARWFLLRRTWRDSVHQPRDVNGVLVVDVKPGSVADDIGLAPGT